MTAHSEQRKSMDSYFLYLYKFSNKLKFPLRVTNLLKGSNPKKAKG